MLRSLRALAVALLLGIGLLAAPPAAPHAVLAAAPLPACKLVDMLTIPRGYDDWKSTLVDWNLSVGKGYVPPDLVSISAAGVTGGGEIRHVAFDDLAAMADAARANGTPLGNVSSYRSYNTQKALFNSYAKGYGYARAVTFSARPGHSEHQLGVTIDFAAAGTSTFVSEKVGAGRWLSKNAWKFGWLMSYPKGKSDVVCYSYEPWHYRYFGRELAKEIHDSGLTTREYLWSHFTQVDVKTGSRIPLTAIAPSTSPSTPPSLPAEASAAPASPSTASPSEMRGAVAAPVRTDPSTSDPPIAPLLTPAGTWFGLDPPLALIGVVLIISAIGALGAVGFRRRPRRS